MFSDYKFLSGFWKRYAPIGILVLLGIFLFVLYLENSQVALASLYCATQDGSQHWYCNECSFKQIACSTGWKNCSYYQTSDGNWCYQVCECDSAELQGNTLLNCGSPSSQCQYSSSWCSYYLGSVSNVYGYHWCASSDTSGGGGTPSIDVSLSPSLNIINQGQSTAYTVTVVSGGGFSGNVTLSLSGCPSNATCSFNNPSLDVPSGGSASTNLNVTSTIRTPTGNYTLTVTGDGSGVSDADSVTLQVNTGPAICDSAWHPIPGNGNTLSQPVGIFVPSSASSLLRNNINVVMRGLDNGVYTTFCGFSFSDPCTWFGTWQLLQNGYTVDSPHAYLDSSTNLHIVVKGTDGKIYDNTNTGGGWLSWQAISQTSWPWGTPTTTTDSAGRTWEFRRETDNSISFRCGNLTPAPTVDIKAGGSDGPISITYNTPSTISWTSSNATSCLVTKNGSNFSTALSNSGASSGNLTSDTTFTLSCSGPGGTATDSVNINILSVSLSASPNSGTAPLNNVSLTANVSGTSSGTYRYFFDCDNNGIDELDTGDISNNPYTASNLCNYSTSGIKTAKVTVWHNQGTATKTATITVSLGDQPPTVSNVTITQPDYCTGPGAYVNWTYSDPENTPQSAYQVQIDDLGSAWNPPFAVDSGKISNSGTSYFASSLAFNTTYKARVRVWDANGNVSNWTESSSWKTPKHPYPQVNFTYSPSSNIPANQPVQFTDQTVFYDGGGGTRTWNWLFKAPAPTPSSTLQNPAYTYTSAGSYQVQETVTDKDGYSCSITKQVDIILPIPIWKEVSPR
jgi:hypothetical protein